MAFRYPYSFPPQGISLVVLALLYLLPGLLGHDPWKSDDVQQIATVVATLQDGQWWAPSLPGLEQHIFAPLPIWLGALCAKLLFFLPLHDAIRCATGLVGAAFLTGLYRLLRHNRRREEASAGVLLAMGSLGLLVPIHESQPAIYLLLAGLLAYLGWQERQPGWLILAPALGLLSGGLYGFLLVWPLSIWAIPLAATRGQRLSALFTAMGGLLTAALWPVLLQHFAPEASALWWHQESKRFSLDTLFLHLGHSLELLSWFAWPIWPVSVWALWQRWRPRPLTQTLPPGMVEPPPQHPLLPLAVLAFLWSVLLFAGLSAPRNTQALPIVLPLIILAAPAASQLRRGAANAYDWFGMMTFTLLIVLIWLGWCAMALGWPEKIASNVARLLPGFQFTVQPLAVCAALLWTLGWLALTFASPRRSPWRGSTHWAVGMLSLWGLLMLLWLPALDYGRSYRPVAEDLAAQLSKHRGCVAAVGVGPSQSAAFFYFQQLRLQRNDASDDPTCTMLLVQSNTRLPEPELDRAWQAVWQGRRASDRDELFRLYRWSASKRQAHVPDNPDEPSPDVNTIRIPFIPGKSQP